MISISVVITEQHLTQSREWYKTQGVYLAGSVQVITSSTHNPISLAIHEADHNAYAFIDYRSVMVVRGQSYFLKWSALPKQCMELLTAFDRQAWFDAEIILRGGSSSVPDLCKERDAIEFPPLPITFTIKVPEYVPPVKVEATEASKTGTTKTKATSEAKSTKATSTKAAKSAKKEATTKSAKSAKKEAVK